MTPQTFIKKIQPLVQEENQRQGNPLFNSVVIAQAAVESGWGNSTIMMKANAIFGIKATSDWKGKVYNSKTQEVYNGKDYTTIDATFRAYDNLADSIKDYFNLICNLERYKKAIHSQSPRACITAIKEGGYATSPTYIDTIMSVINNFKLTLYDEISHNSTIKLPNYKKNQNYTLRVDLNVRVKAGIDQKQKTRNQLTQDGKNKSYNQTNAVLKKGTIVTVLDSAIKNKNEVWLKIPSGWIAGYYKGEYYVS